MDDDPKDLLYRRDGAVAYLTLNRPEKRNALNGSLIAQLKDSLRRAAADENVRVILLRGAGSDFCSGADLAALKKLAGASVTDNSADAESLMELFTFMRKISIPVVAAVNGRALAGGCGLATACDLVLATRSARFGYPEVKIGFVPAMVTAILRRNVSEKRAFELLVRGNEISSDEAREIGLVNHVFGDDSFESETDAYVKSFETVSRSAVGLTKTLLYQIDGLSFREAIQAGADVNVIARMTTDCQSGIARFLKRD